MNEEMLNGMLLDALSWAREAGAVQMRHFRQSDLVAMPKLNQADVVTIADREAEKIILDNIRKTYPDHSILSEESGEDLHEKADLRWVIDPLDGTTNYSSGLPVFSVSIALKYKEETVLGVVFLPYLNEMYHAVKGQGAYLNGERITASEKVSLDRCVVCTGFPVDRSTCADNNLDNFTNILPLVRGMRRIGSSAADLCYVAAGFLDAFWEINLHEWDVAAGLLIVNEAGGRTVRFRPDRNYCILAAGKNVFDLILPLLNTEPRR